MSSAKKWGRLFKTLLGLFVVFIVPSLLVNFDYIGRIYNSVKVIPDSPWVVVMGASMYGSNQPSPVLQQRLDAAVKLYQAKKVGQLMVSGDNQNQKEADEMANYLVREGIPAHLIKIDRQGDSTLTTCKHLQNFRIEQSIIISQSFHLPRTLMFCERAGLNVTGLAADSVAPMPNHLDGWQTFQIRIGRFFRETALMWAYWLHIYR